MRHDSRSKNFILRALGRIGFYVLVIFIVCFCLAPFIWQVITSLKPSEEVFAIPPRYLPSKLTISSYVKIFTARPFGRYIVNSILVASMTTLVCGAVGSLAAYALARFRMRAKGIIMGSVLGVALFPAIIFLVPLYEIVRSLGLTNNLITLVVPYVTLNLPFATWVMTSFFGQVPEDIEDAAKVDGMGSLGILAKIVLPLAAPAMATMSILVFIFAWNEFLFALTFMTQDLSRTVPVGIAMLSGVTVYEVPWDQISAATVLTTLPLVAAVLIFQERIVQGLTAGALKG
ncbi:MAG TPA: carbohydrate ABC transporter permease [Firmicutes bacterium]|nr:carbohydrate ABC transporter permease [Bacillota bacterium]